VRVFWKDRNLRYLGCNSIFLKDAGLTDVNDIIGKDDYQMSWRKQADLYRNDDSEVMESGNPKLNIEEPQTSPDGKNRTLLTSKIPLRNSKGELNGILGTYTDISERKQVEEALRKSKLRFDKLASNIPVGVYVLHSEADGSFKLDYASPRMAEMLGLSVEGLLNEARLVYETIYPDDRIGFTELSEKGIRLKQAFDWTGRVYVEGKIKWMHFNSSPELLENGEILWHGLVVDVTKEKLAEDEINEAHSRLQKIAGQIPGVVFQFKLRPDGTSCFPYASERIKEIYDVSPEDVIDNASVAIKNLYPDDIPGFRASIYASAANLSPWEYEYRVKHDGTKLRWLMGSALPQKEPDGSVLWYGIVTDITERKHIEQQIQTKNEELIKVNIEKDKFFSIIAHDLRGPIGGFMGLTERMAEGMNDMTTDQLHNIARIMKKSSSNLYSLLSNLLEWSSMQRGLTSFEPVSFHLSPKIRESLATTFDAAIKKGIEINNTISDDLEVFADKNMLATIIRNLMSNAVKFTPKSGKISISATLTNGNFIAISISDNGIGMNRDIIENLFNFDINTSRKGTDGELSTGLGLMICKDFIEMHGGVITIESKAGEGSTFRFTIPVTDSL